MDEHEFAPFYVGEIVLCIDALNGASVKNGLLYTVWKCETYKGQDGKLYYGVGVQGNGIRTYFPIRPSIFRSIDIMENMSFAEITEECPIGAN